MELENVYHAISKRYEVIVIKQHRLFNIFIK